MTWVFPVFLKVYIKMFCTLVSKGSVLIVFNSFIFRCFVHELLRGIFFSRVPNKKGINM